MSPLVRGLIILLILIWGIAYIIIQKAQNIPLNKRCYNFLIKLSIIFPFLEPAVVRNDLSISVGTTLIGIFWIINLSLFRSFFRRQFIWIFVFILICLCSAILSDFPINSILSIYTYLVIFLYFFTCLYAIKSSSHTDFLDIIVRNIGIWILLFAFIQIFFNQSFTFFYQIRIDGSRLDYCFVDPQTAGVVTAFISIFYFNKYIYSQPGKNLLFFIVFLILTALTGSKSAILAIGFGIVLSMLANGVKLKYVILGVIFIIAICIAYTLLSELVIFERLNEFDSSLNTRQSVYWAKAYQIFWDNWLTGIGPGNFKLYNIEHNIGLTHWTKNGNIFASQPESGYLLLLDEFGIWTIIPFLLVLSLFRIRSKSYYNFSLLSPWLIGSISLSSLGYISVSFVLSIIAAAIYYNNEHGVRYNRVIKPNQLTRKNIIL